MLFQQANIDISFECGVHGATNETFLSDVQMAHSYGPPIGKIHLNDIYNWKSRDRLLSVALHEIGRALGLSYSNDWNSVMWWYSTNLKLGSDDVMGIQVCYLHKIDSTVEN